MVSKGVVYTYICARVKDREWTKVPITIQEPL